MSIAHDKKMMGRLQRAAAVAALLAAGAMTAGCSHTAPAPMVAVPPTSAAPTAVAPTGAPAPPGATTVSPMSAGDQQEMQKKQDENKGITAPP